MHSENRWWNFDRHQQKISIANELQKTFLTTSKSESLAKFWGVTSIIFWKGPFVVFMAKISSHIVRSVRLPEKRSVVSSSSGGSRPYRAVAREAERQLAYEARGSKATPLFLSLPPPLLYHFVYQWEGKRAGQYSVVTYCSFGKAPVPFQKKSL